jgi:uncharacterized protein YndB with AHSA1/START domain
MGLDDPAASGMREHRESFESAGEVVGWVTDLQAAWEAEQLRGRMKVTDEDAVAVIPMPTAAVPREILWEWATSPARRLRWTTDLTKVEEDAVAGRRGVGTVNDCMHGNDPFIEEVLDWVPPEYLTKRISSPGIPPFIPSMELIEMAAADAREREAGRSAEPDVLPSAARYRSEPTRAA